MMKYLYKSMKIRIFAFAAIAVLLLAACDDGRIYNEVAVDTTGRSARLTATITGLDHWTDNYTVSLAGFAEGDDYASISKAVRANADGQVSMTLNNIPDQVTSVRLCVLDRLRRNVVTFSEVATEGVRDTIRLELGTVDASMLNAIQQGYLNTTCANCHGASNHAAAGLNLTAGKSYAALVGVASRKVEGHQLVAPGNAAESVLHMVLHNEHVEGISMNHFDLVSEKNEELILPLIDSWIDGGAEQ